MKTAEQNPKISYLLFIYNEIPENIRFYAVPRDSELIPKLEAVNGFVVNVHDWPEVGDFEETLNFVQDALSKTEHGGTNYLAEYEIQQVELPRRKFEGVVNFGFYM